MSHPIEISALVEAVVERITELYIFPQHATQAAALLRAKLADGAYDGAVGPDLCERLSADLFAICADKHLRLIWHESAQASQDEEHLVAALRERFLDELEA